MAQPFALSNTLRRLFSTSLTHTPSTVATSRQSNRLRQLPPEAYYFNHTQNLFLEIPPLPSSPPPSPVTAPPTSPPTTTMTDWKVPGNHPVLNLEASNLPEWELRTVMQLSTVATGTSFAADLLKAETTPQDPDPSAIANVRNFLVSSVHLSHAQAIMTMTPSDAFAHLKSLGPRRSVEDHIDATPTPDFNNCLSVDDFSNKLLTYFANISAIDSSSHHVSPRAKLRLAFRSLPNTPIAHQLKLSWQHTMPINEPTHSSFLALMDELKSSGIKPHRNSSSNNNQHQQRQNQQHHIQGRHPPPHRRQHGYYPNGAPPQYNRPRGLENPSPPYTCPPCGMDNHRPGHRNFPCSANFPTPAPPGPPQQLFPSRAPSQYQPHYQQQQQQFRPFRPPQTPQTRPRREPFNFASMAQAAFEAGQRAPILATPEQQEHPGDSNAESHDQFFDARAVNEEGADRFPFYYSPSPILDSGASAHLFPSADSFTNKQSVDVPISVADGSFITAVTRGKTSLHTGTSLLPLSSALHVPNLARPLISAALLAKDFCITMLRDKFYISTSSNKPPAADIVASGSRQNNIYVF